MGEIEEAGHLSDGRVVRRVTLRSDRLVAEVLDHGARLVSVRLDDGPNMTVGSRDLADYEGALKYAGPIVAPVVNRITGAAAELEGQTLGFEANQAGRHSLHSGGAGTHAKIWDIVEATTEAVTLRAEMPDGEGGFPGNSVITAIYRVEGPDILLEIEGATDQVTFFNPAHHGVWNLDGVADYAGHLLMVPAERYLPVDGDTLPTGEIAPVEGTVYDHRAARGPDRTLDHNFCFEGGFGLRARLDAPSGRWMEVHSDAPGCQVFAGRPQGIAIEPQLWPDAPHNPGFPPIVLRPGETFRQVTRFRFGG
ncbi:aldose epimerase family protein [Ovoidimarina sediminis]|uniref:aldose epimerase family protein n=1 Tax=Ovoidimarina sediminis TaxID=3079856 RepID=UPI00291098D5|nr:aldose epimerase family protein [Rhodophyticola sp. MJ-SS7]MDU8942859.1 aldose epimerase family protein [Rhodophyticola sp. MJ-SS7]